MTNFYEEYKKILNNPNLTKNQKVELLQKAKENYDKEVDAARDKEIAQYRLGAALEIGSAAIPMGGIGRLGAQAGMDVLKSTLGKKISQEIGSGIAGGLAGGTVFGAGRGMMENKNPIVTAAQDAAAGAILGGTLGAGGAYLQKGILGKKLENSNPEKGINRNEMNTLRKEGKQYFNDYLNELQIKTNNGDIINFPNSQAGEIALHNYKMIPKLPEQIKTAKNHIQSNDKPERLDADGFQKMYNTYNGKNYEYIIRNNSNKTGNDFYQIKEVGSNPAYSNQNRALELEPNTIIPNNIREFNPPFSQRDISSMTKEEFTHYEPVIMDEMAHGKIIMDGENSWSKKVEPMNLNGNIFTREQIGKMSSDEYRKNEAAIMKQWKEKGIPTNKELENARSKQNSKPNTSGHWVTINSKHVFMED